MRKKASLAALLMLGVLGVSLLASCAPKESTSAVPSNPVLTASPVPSEESASPSPSGSLDPALASPLEETTRDLAAPTFLDQEQQDLYRRAYSLYTHLFGCDTSGAEYAETFDGAFPPADYDSTEINGYQYLISQGRYRLWDDFSAVVQSAFTEEFFAEKNTWEGSSGKTMETFTNYGGLLCFIDAARGGGYYYNQNFKDTFELTERTDSTIRFSVIGHYSQMAPLEGETSEACDKRVTEGYEYTKAIPITLVLTDSGWRFSQFSTAILDEGEYQGSLGV